MVDKNTDKEQENSSEENDEPIPSGTGAVSKDCSESELMGWSEILPKWHIKLHQNSQRPKGLDTLVRNSIPEPLRGEVWQLLSGAQQCTELMEQYRILLTKSAPSESNILRDVHRTYPAHESFRSGPTSLLDSLFKVCKAYAVYDEGIGYCQGLSFLVAALLIHMPEEQSFSVIVRIMHHYGLRNLFRSNLDELYLKFYQLEQLLHEHLPELYWHFTNLKLEPSHYASQWFLTVFTAKFPLNAVFYIMDIFLLDGMDTIFQIALALLESSKQELLAQDFEGVLKFFRVQMPKLYRDPNAVKCLIRKSSKFNLKKLKKYAKDYENMKKEEKISRSYLNTTSDIEDEKMRLQIEVNQLKEVCRRELQRAETDLIRNNAIISDYKKICSQLSQRVEQQQEAAQVFVAKINDTLQENDSSEKCREIFQSQAEEFLNDLRLDSKASSKIQTLEENYDRNMNNVNSSKHINELEVELARTKLALVEAECKCQQLTHARQSVTGSRACKSGGGRR